jgi:two-component system chemotaxis sensor kinase CheA
MSDDKQEGYYDSAENIIKELRATFREEASELLVELESSLLELEKKPDDKEQIGRVFRAMHTIKGSGGACEFREVAAFVHEIESIYDKIRSGKVNATPEIINLTLQARDQIKAMLNTYYLGGSIDEAKGASILASFKKLLAESVVNIPVVPNPPDKLPVASKRTKTYRIRFRPSAEVFVQGTNPVNLLNELRELGMCKVVAQTEAIPCLEDFESQSNYTYWDVILTTNRGINVIQDVFIFIKDAAEVKIEVIDEEGSLENEMSYKYLGDILVERGDLSPEDLQKVLKGKKRFGELLIETGIVPHAKIESALVEQQHVRDLRERRLGADITSSIRVATGKLDTLVNLVGELVTVQARLTQAALSSGLPVFLSIAEEVERLTASLRDNTMNMRMLPIGTTFGKFKRLVRDLSSELGKEIELTTDGAETELDKTVIERMSDPLVHIIRNSIDHGIELPSARTTAGKPRQGTIHLSAMHSGAHVLIRVKDDGAGLDAERIRAKAVEKGLILANAILTDQELWEFILMPGFSTAKKVSGVSGRGVGMDVVKRAIDALRGSLEIASVTGRGTTITLKLPLTLAIIDGFLTRIGAEHFIFPMWLVEECVELSPEDTSKTHARRLAHVRGEIVPYIRLRDYFGFKGRAFGFEQIVIVSVDNKRVGLVVDSIVGEQQTVLKSLGKYYCDVKGISGATILGDGAVALVLDIPKLVQTVESEETTRDRHQGTQQ